MTPLCLPGLWTRRHARELTWFLGQGTSAVLPRGICYEDKIEAVRWGHEPVYDISDGDVLVRYGRVDRALYRLPRLFERVLSYAYGDAGCEAMQTPRGFVPELRWRSIAHMTPLASDRAPEWLAKKGIDVPTGDPRIAWAQELFRVVQKGAGAKAAEGHSLLRKQAESLLAEGERLFALAFDDLVHTERCIATTSLRLARAA